MRRRGLSAILMLAILALAGLAWAATARFTPPAQAGDIFAVVNFARASGANTSTYITVNLVHLGTTSRIGFAGHGSTQVNGFGFNVPFSYFLRAGDYVYCSISTATGFTTDIGLAATQFFMYSLR